MIEVALSIVKQAAESLITQVAGTGVDKALASFERPLTEAVLLGARLMRGC